MARHRTPSLFKRRLIDTPQTFGLVSKILHWTIAVLMMIMLVVGFLFANNYPAHGHPLRPVVYNLHKNTGLTIFLLATFWTLWRLFNRHPTLSLSPWQALLARANFIFLFLLLLLFPITGVGMSLFHGHDIAYFNILKIAGVHPAQPEIGDIFLNAHYILAYCLLVSLLLHLAGFFYHLFEGNDEIKKML